MPHKSLALANQSCASKVSNCELGRGSLPITCYNYSVDKTLSDSMLAIQELFRSARQQILSGVGQAATEHKEDGSPVTATDLAIEQHVIQAMQQQFPDLPVCGEETGYDSHALPKTCWLIDPIDGTKSYIQNIPAFTSMAVLIHDDAAVASIIYDPTTDDMYTAVLGQGAQKNGQKLGLTQTPMPQKVRCKDVFAEGVATILKEKSIEVEIAPSGAGYGFANVVDGVSAARFQLHAGTNIHDHAPGALLVKEAGGDIIPIFSDTYSYRTYSFVACHPELAAFIRSRLPEIRALEHPEQALL